MLERMLYIIRGMKDISKLTRLLVVVALRLGELDNRPASEVLETAARALREDGS